MLGLRNRRIKNLSGPQQQRVFLVRTLAQQADILLVDEPFAGVDQPSEGIVFEASKAQRTPEQGMMLAN